MHYIRTMLSLIMLVGMVTYGLIAYPIINRPGSHLPQILWQRQLTDSEVNLFTSKQKIKPECGQLVIFHQQGGSWSFGVVSKQWPDEYYDVTTLDNRTVHKHTALSSIKALTSTWNELFQPTVSLDKMRNLLDERNNYYKVHGAPDGHGMILPPQSRIAFLGDLHGNFTSLQSHLAYIYKDGLLDEQFHLKPNCYVVGLGDYTGDGGEGILVMKTLLTLQENNPNQVFLLRGDHEDISKAQIDGFQKEWYGKFGLTKKEFCFSEMVWLKMLMFWKSLPKLLMVGLQMPSTQHYDFIMFCHGSFDFTWRPDALLSRVVQKHIDHNFKAPCVIDYRDELCTDTSFANGTFADDDDVINMRAKKAAQGPIWSKSAFAQFIKQYASRIDKKHMYQYCLCAIVRGHDHIPGGLVTLKRKGLKTWKSLKDNKMYEIEPCSVYTCTSGSHCMSKAGCFEGAFGLIEAGRNGHWYITSHLEQ